MFGVKIEEKKVPAHMQVLILLCKVIQAPVKFIRKRRATAQRKLLAAERRRLNMYRRLDIETEIHEKELFVLELMTEEVLHKVDHTDRITSITEEITGLQLKLHQLL